MAACMQLAANPSVTAGPTVQNALMTTPYMDATAQNNITEQKPDKWISV
jgi:hypothetical protein